MTFVATLEPTALWGHFDTILTIPRGSKNEDRMRRTVVEIAERAGLDHDIDPAGNVVVRKPATAGHEDAPITILQSHLDMVNEKNTDHPHDFATDPIIPQQAGEYLTADGTTLGSDNGIGVATMLAVMEATDLTHGPLEFLFTIDEETGLTGASELDASLVKGRQLINLDSEEEGILYVGCAGGGESRLTLDLVTIEATGTSVTLAVALKGLKGGHSGCDVHLQRGNAIKLLSRLLWTAYLDTPFLLAGVEGGSAHNAIPREAFAQVVVERESRDAVVAAIESDLAAVRTEYGPADPGMTLSIDDAASPSAVWDHATSETVLSLLNTLPHGVGAMSYDIPDLVETSINLATIRPDGNNVTISLSGRSSIDSALESLRRQVRAHGVLAGATIDEDAPYPGWKPNLESHLLEVVKAVHASEFGHEPEVKAIHAGLECGILGKKAPGMDMISFGPVIEFPHSPDERVQIASVGRFYQLLTATLEHLVR
jgi:dipeptidase D